MIFIIRALSQWGKDDEYYDFPTSWDENSDLIKKEKKEKGQKEKKEAKEKEKKEKEKNERKREKGQCYYLFFHTCASK